MRRILFALAIVFIGSLLGVHARGDEWPSPMPLPNPLILLDGAAVTTADQWQAKRKPELRTLFQRHMYGRYPDPRPPAPSKHARSSKT